MITICGKVLHGLGILCVTCAFVAGCGKPAREISMPASLLIGRITEAPVIDGMLNDACWDSLDAIMLARCDTGGEPALPTNVRAGYDESHIYIGFECQDPDAASTVSSYDGPVYTGDHIAVYLDADSDTTTYAIIEIAPSGAVRDAFVLSKPDGSSRLFLSEWRCTDMRVSVTVYGGDATAGTEDRFWTVEMAIPFTAFVTSPRIPQSGDTWRANMFRAETAGTREYSALVPTGSESFHRPAEFGLIRYK